MIALRRDSRTPLFRQIYTALRDAILSGKLTSGERVPPTRALADELGVSRMSVVLAYEHLASEGYLLGKGSAGTVVANLIVAREPARPLATRSPANPAFDLQPVRRAITPFRLGEPALDEFPIRLWNRIRARWARRLPPSALGYGDASGYKHLAAAVVEYVRVSRNVRAEAEQVILVRGAQPAADLTLRVLLQPGERVWVEDPGYLVVRKLIEFAGGVLTPVPIDRDGLVVEEGKRRAPNARMVCLAPSHHFPLGCRLSLERRLALIEWARRAKAWILEDDFDSEFRYDGPPIASLQGLDTAGRVIYVGTFSKTLFPALRLGYLVVPPALVDRFRAAQSIVDHLATTVDQITLTEFIRDGHFTRHVRKMRTLYAERQRTMVSAVRRELGEWLSVEPAETGMHVIAWFRDPRVNDIAVSQAAWRAGIEARALSRYTIKAKLPPALVLGFGALRAEGISRGVKTLRKVLQQTAK